MLSILTTPLTLAVTTILRLIEMVIFIHSFTAEKKFIFIRGTSYTTILHALAVFVHIHNCIV